MSLYSARTCSRRCAIAVADISLASRLVVSIGSLEYCDVGEILRAPSEPLHRHKTRARHDRNDAFAPGDDDAAVPDLLQPWPCDDEVEGHQFIRLGVELRHPLHLSRLASAETEHHLAG